MEKVKEYIDNRIAELNEEIKVCLMSEDYYRTIDVRIEELELMLRSLNVA